MAAAFQTLAGDGQNRYKWLTFSEQLSRVDIGAVRRIGAVYEELPEVSKPEAACCACLVCCACFDCCACLVCLVCRACFDCRGCHM